jgi:hypothetical protein
VRRRSEKGRWLDSLARWTVRGEGAGPRAGSDTGLHVAPGGTTRRTALRAVAGAAGVAALGGPLRLAEPASAGAAQTTLSKCQTESFEKVSTDFQACVKNPLEELEDTTELLRIYEGSSSAKKPLSKKAKKVLAGLRRRRAKAIKDIEFCNALFGQERAEGEEDCHAKNKPPSEPGNGGGTKTPGCEAGYLLCGEYCCDTSNAFCQGCGTPTCCRIEGNCCPSGG